MESKNICHSSWRTISKLGRYESSYQSTKELNEYVNKAWIMKPDDNSHFRLVFEHEVRDEVLPDFHNHLLHWVQEIS